MGDKKNEGSLLNFFTGLVAGASLALYLTTPDGKKTFKHFKGRFGELLDEAEKIFSEAGLGSEKARKEKEETIEGEVEGEENSLVTPPHITEIQERGRNQFRRFFRNLP